MNEGQKPVPEKPLSPDDYASLANIVSWVNTCLERNYPGLVAPLALDQIKIVPDELLLDVVNGETLEAFHPFARDIFDAISLRTTGKRLLPATNLSEWYGSSDHQTVYLAGHNIENLRKNEIENSLLLGLALCAAAVEVSSSWATDISEEAQMLAPGLIKSINDFFHSGASEEDISRMAEYMKGKESGILRIGATDVVLVEGKIFGPSMGTDEHNSILNYILRPVRSDYADVIAREMNLNPLQAARLRSQAQEPADDKRIAALEKPIVARLSKVGLRSRREITQSFLNGEIGIKLRRTVG